MGHEICDGDSGVMATALPLELRPLTSRRPTLLVIAATATAGWIFACFRMLTADHHLSATDSYGATWGITVANIIHVIGISHVGIAVSATVRVLRLEAYRNLARLAELVTLVALLTAVLNISIDVGRPDRFITAILVHGRWHAPMVWSMTVIVTYLLVSSVYLYLSLRPDLAALDRTKITRRGFYRALSLRYRDTPVERRRHEQTLFWLAILLVPIMVSVHSIYGLFFGLLPARPGWYNPLQGPYFVLGAIVSGFSALVVLAAIVRRAYGWRELIPDRTFRVSSAFLAFVLFLYMYFLISEHFTAQYAGPPGERAISDALLSGEYAWTFWLTTIVGLVAPFVVLFLFAVRRATDVRAITLAALAANVGMWFKRFLLVVPPQYQSHLPPPRPSGDYVPTGTELAVTLGSYAFAVLVFMLLLRLVPVMGLGGDPDTPTRPARSRRSLRIAATLAALVLGTLSIAWGVATRQQDFAVLKWLVGILFFAAIPLLICMIADGPHRGGEPDAPGVRS